MFYQTRRKLAEVLLKDKEKLDEPVFADLWGPEDVEWDLEDAGIEATDEAKAELLAWFAKDYDPSCGMGSDKREAIIKHRMAYLIDADGKEDE